MRSAIEVLEPRKLLFSITVTDDPDGDGIGTIGATFGYVIPYITREIPDAQEPNTEAEEFDDEDEPWTEQVPAVPPSGTFFSTSGIRLTYSTISTQPVFLINGPDTDIEGEQQDDQDLQVLLTTNDSATFSFFQTTEVNPEPPVLPRVVSSATVTIGGLDLSALGSKIELLRNGIVVATLRGQQLVDISAPALAGGNTPEQINQNRVYTLQDNFGFDAFRISSSQASPDNNNYFDRFFVDDITQTFPTGRFGGFNEERIFGVRVVLTGPIGASVEFLDLYGRQMRNTLALGVPPNSEVALVDVNDDGVPEFNDGIGRINITGSNLDTSLTMIGGTISLEDNVFVFELIDNPLGLLDDMQSAGFGYDIVPGDPPTPTGLPSGSGSIIIGSPFVRNNSSADNYRNGNFGPANHNYNNPNQGIFVTQASQSIGSVVVHGVIHGSSQFAGAVGRLNLGVLMGSVTIQGDLGTMAVAGDAGVWSHDETAPPRTIIRTGSEVFVGRSVGEIAIGARSLADVTVQGDINNTARAVFPYYEYIEKEQIANIDPATDDGVRVTLQNFLNTPFRQQPLFYGVDFYHNNTIMGAEFVGFNSSSAHITGTLGFNNPITTAEDTSDVFAFAVDGTTDVVLSVTDVRYARIVDADGRVIVAHQFLEDGNTARFSFRPDHADVYYLVLASPTTTAYDVTISGLAAVTLGSFRSGAHHGGTVASGNILTLAAGSMGSLRVGTGVVTGDGSETNTAGMTNFEGEEVATMNFRVSTTTVAGNLYNITAGSDVTGAQLFIGGNLGTFRTGLSPVAGAPGPTSGDFRQLTLEVNGTVGVLDVRGGIGWNHDATPPGPTPANSVNIRTGISGSAGHIGSILVGDLIYGPALNVTALNQATINQFFVGTGGDGGNFPGQILGSRVPDFLMGTGADVRFVDFTQVENGADPNAFQPLAYGQTITLTDDSGASVAFRIVGFAPGEQAAALTSTAIIRFLPIDNSLGVAIARVEATLNGGASLEIVGLTPGLVTIGHVQITTDDVGGSNVTITSQNTEIDVGLITQSEDAEAPLGVVRNNTPNGDIVAMDVIGLAQLIIFNGNLGRTQTNNVGPNLLGPYLGIGQGLAGDVGGAIGIDADAINDSWNGQIYVPVSGAGWDFDADETLEDLGSPFTGYLNGLIVRTGNVVEITVGGAVGDVILQDPAGVLQRLVANADGISALSAFEGIVGSVYAADINFIDVGAGLVGPGNGPMAQAGIFAADDILQISGRHALNPRINGVIIARNADDTGPANQQGLVNVHIVMGSYDQAFMGASIFDEFWTSSRFFDDVGRGDDLDEDVRGPVGNISGELTSIFRSRIIGDDVNSINFPSGDWDATTLNATGNVNFVFAREFRNSTLVGEPLEVRDNEIRATGNLTTLSASGSTGDISDLLVDIQGSLLNAILARNITRGDLQIDGTAASIYVANDLRATNLTLGRLTSLNVVNDIRASQVDVSGPILQLIAGQNITNTRIQVTGPNGRIETLRTRFFLTGEIISSGPINSISSTEGDIIASIRTINPGATVQSITAGRDLIIDTDIASDVTMIQAGRNIGELNEARGSRAINIRGNLNTITTPNGQIYTDVRVGQSITGTIRTGRVAALPGNDQVSRATYSAYGRINSVDFNGDFNGSLISESGGIGVVTITNGSFRPGNVIRANDGSIDSVIIRGGHLLGDIIAEEGIGAVRVLVGADGFSGDIGVNSDRSQYWFFDPLRNQLPPGVEPVPTFQGPRIQAGANINLVEVERGSMFETGIYAGAAVLRVFVFGEILNDDVTPGLGGSFIVGGDSVMSVEALQFAGGVIIAAGVTSLGADNRPGGTGANTDTVQFGRIGDITLRGGAGAVTVSAGMNAGADGIYNTPDDAVANGLSSINSFTVIGAAVGGTSAFADNGIGFTSPGIVRGGPGLHQAEPNKVIEFVPSGGLVPSGGMNFTTTVGETGRITLTGPGQAYFEQVFDAGLGRNVNRLALINTTSASRLVVDTTTNSLTDFRILSNDGASLGSGSIRANLFGDSSFYYDGYVNFVEFGGLNSTGSIGAGNDIGRLVFGSVTRGTIDANHIQELIVGGNFGSPNVAGDAIIRVLSGGNFTIYGNNAGLITSKRDLGAIQVLGTMENAELRTGRSLVSLSTTAMNNVKVSSRNNIGTVTVSGNVTSSIIYAGTDLGADGTFGGTGDNADVVTNGNITTVNVSGNFVRSDIAAGVSRGADRFLGTADDIADEGHSSIGSVIIGGSQVGSTINSESYRIVTNGAVAPVRVAGNTNFTGLGNFQVNRIDATPDALQVSDLRVVEGGGVYTAFIEFNQPVIYSSVSPSLNIFEVRDGGTRTVRLAENIDFSLQPTSNPAIVQITFSQAVTRRDLPQLNGVPGPGVYRFTLDAATIRGQTQSAMLDGNGDGVPAGPDDDYSADNFVGDVGDKIDPNPADNNNAGVPVFGPNGERVDFYFAGDLNVVMDNNSSSDGLPDVNRPFTVRGTIGDHPDNNTNFFRFTSDIDVYRVTLRAGQILRLGKMQGVAQLANRVLMDAAGNIINGSNNLVQVLPSTPRLGTDTSAVLEQQFLIKQTGTYFITVGARVDPGVVTDVTNVPNIPTIAGSIGQYNFSVEVFDDSDTGFNGDTDSGNGVNVVNAPVPSAFPAGSNTLISGGVTFTLSHGADGVRNTRDDFVTGTIGGITSQRTSGPDGVFGTADDLVASYVSASIGNAGHTGVPSLVQPDIDVFKLNNGDFITPGTRVRATLQLTEFGSNIGLSSDPLEQDLRGTVQFAIFNITNSVNITDGVLVAGSTDVLPVGGIPNDITSNGVTSYGYDANGDFFMEFIVPANAGNSPGRFALYVQGSIRSDYQLQIITQGTGVINRVTQNIVIETNGGTVDWLEAGRGVNTTVGPFRASSVGFSGLIGGQTVDNYIISNLIANLIDVFAAANIDINVSADPSAFEGQSYSTVFLTGTNEPLAFFDNGTFGVSEHSDAFNTDLNDEAIIFLPALGTLGYSPAQVDVDRFVQSLTAATARRVGELVGLRTLSAVGGNDVMAANSVRSLAGNAPQPGPYRFSNGNIDLSPNGDALPDTDFFLGRQNSVNLLNRLLLPNQ